MHDTRPTSQMKIDTISTTSYNSTRQNAKEKIIYNMYIIYYMIWSAEVDLYLVFMLFFSTRFGGLEGNGDRARWSQAGQHNVLLRHREQSPGENHRFRLGVLCEGGAHHVQHEDPGNPVPRVGSVLPRQPGPRRGPVVVGVHHAGNSHRRQAVRRDQRGTVGEIVHQFAGRSRFLDIRPGETKDERRSETFRRLDSFPG